jgi:MPBQ/MSBQ methyltransferase
MGSDRLQGRIADQFSYRGERSDIWRLFDLLLETDAFLNLGYSEWYQPHIAGSPQRRLATEVGERLVAHRPETDGGRLLDVGCGRGGPAIHLADQFGSPVVGIDLVPYNVARARKNVAERGPDAEFAVGDATRLPFAADSLSACTAIDALVYLSDRPAVVAEIGDVLEPGGVVVLSELVRRQCADTAKREQVARFAEAWDMPLPGTVPDYERALADAGLSLVSVDDITPHSVGSFRKWTTLFGWLYAGPAGRLVDWLLARQGLDPTTVVDQIRRAHEALPALGHVIFVARA